MLRRAGISEIYTRGHPLSLLSLSLFRPREPVSRYITCHVPSCLVSFVFYRLPLPPLSLLSSHRQRDWQWVIQWFVLLIMELRGKRYNGSVESTREWNERRELRISRKMKGRHLRVENTRRASIFSRPLYITCFLFPTLPGMPVGRSQFSRRAIYFRISFWHPWVVIVVIVVARHISNGREISHTYKLHETYLSRSFARKGAGKGFCPLSAILVSGERFNAELIWRELTEQKGVPTGCSPNNVSNLEETRQEYAL